MPAKAEPLARFLDRACALRYIRAAAAKDDCAFVEALRDVAEVISSFTQCANANCGKTFLRMDSREKYCSVTCRKTVAMRVYRAKKRRAQ